MKSLARVTPILPFVIFVITASFFVFPTGTFADPLPSNPTGDPGFYGSGSNPGTSLPGSNPGTPTQSGGGVAIQNPLQVGSIAEFVQKLLQAVVAIGVPIAVLFIVLAGFKFVTARGNPEELKVARTNFVHVVVGVAIFIGAWAIAQLIVATLRQIGAHV